ncbi:glycoside hydrolase family 2 TIM barrel-domain containing protein [uncultured Aquimarina sp.]|uniref:glycoside hydrolase family 2 protein n=1 Tax=uncultured Aquimarina sp. TaxID=575652 RepID=UPI00260736DD|nr:glycoside hydrolase family 2 TIM barrel-domain containing protein [uncultured Aquimarina sp.]
MNNTILSSCNLIKIVVFVFFSTCCSAQVYTSKENINNDWEYLELNLDSVDQVHKQTDWESINLPHTWNNFDTMDLRPGYRRSASWYRRYIQIDTIDKKLAHQLYFEGSNITTQVYVNGKFSGEHIGGYIGFSFDISDQLRIGKNEILVRVDNSYNPEIIPSQKSDFFIYGGITRDVWFIKKYTTNISNLKITTPDVSEEKASLRLDLEIEDLKVKEEYELVAQLFEPSGKKIQTVSKKVNNSQLTIDFKNITKPLLWGIDVPNLYKVEILLLKSGEQVDKLMDRFGFRWFEFKKNGPFYLNGKRVLLRGTHRHEEHAGYGAAMPNTLHRKDILTIKEMGANFIRLAHYPQDPEVYKMCDELGILIWDELPWCRGGIGNEKWKTNTKNMLSEIINQNYNHPSVIIWSLGNEIYWLPDFEDGDNEEKLNEFLKELNTLSHTLDPTRMTAIRKYYAGSDIVDVFSPSIWSGWYSGSYTTYEKALKKYIKEYDHFIHAEYGGSSHYARHTENPIDGQGAMDPDGWTEAITQTSVTNIAKIGDWSENYIVDLFDWHLKIAETNISFVGNVQWAFKDFGTPLRPENDIPYVNQKGIMDREGNPKDSYYVFKSYWAKDPFVYIESHTWTERQGPRDTSRTMNVFSNCDTVEFFFEGKSLGEKKKDINEFPASGLTWDVLFKEGANQLKVIGYKDGVKVTDSLKVNYRYKKNDVAKSLSLSYKKLKNGNYLIIATAKDKEGLRCLDYEERVYFQCLSGGVTKKYLGTPMGSESIKMSNGIAQIEVIPDKENSAIEMMVLNQSFKGTYLTISKQ